MTDMLQWDPAVRTLDDDALAAAHEALRRCGEQCPIGLALVSGSLVMGLGHALSDLDLYVATTDGSPVPSKGFSNGGFSVQVNPVDGNKLRELAGYADTFRVFSSDRTQLGLGLADNKILLRLVNGRVLHAEAEFRELLERLDPQVVRQLTMLRHAIHAVELQEDVRGALRHQDPLTALTASHRALLHALEAGLAGVGEVYDHEKVVLRRLARHPGTGHLLEEVWRLLNCGLPLHAPMARVAEVAQRRSLLTSHLIGHAMLTGWEAPASRIPPFRVADAGPIRAFDFGLLRFADGIALTGSDYGSRVSEGMARLWLALDGSPVEQVASSPLLTDFPVDLPVLQAALARLTRVAAVEDVNRDSPGEGEL